MKVGLVAQLTKNLATTQYAEKRSIEMCCIILHLENTVLVQTQITKPVNG